jgi:hypothetical protein
MTMTCPKVEEVGGGDYDGGGCELMDDSDDDYKARSVAKKAE